MAVLQEVHQVRVTLEVTLYFQLLLALVGVMVVGVLQPQQEVEEVQVVVGRIPALLVEQLHQVLPVKEIMVAQQVMKLAEAAAALALLAEQQ